MRKTYDHEFKLKLSQNLLEKKVTTKRIAEEYNISRPTIPNGFQNIFDTEKMLLLGKDKGLLTRFIVNFQCFFKNH